MTSQKVVKWKCDHFHLSNLKMVFAIVIGAASSKTVGPLFSFQKCNCDALYPRAFLLLVALLPPGAFLSSWSLHTPCSLPTPGASLPPEVFLPFGSFLPPGASLPPGIFLPPGVFLPHGAFLFPWSPPTPCSLPILEPPYPL